MIDLEAYLALIEEERQSRPAEAALADEIHRLRSLTVARSDTRHGDRRRPDRPERRKEHRPVTAAGGRMVELLMVHGLAGHGTAEEPYRQVVHLLDFDGHQLAIYDRTRGGAAYESLADFYDEACR